jgi:AcrR family transcriptional regulator
MLSKYSKRQIEIINIAIELVAQNGIQELTIKNISKKIGLVESAIYRHFKSKQDILLGILDIFKNSKENIFSDVRNKNHSPSVQLKKLFENRFKYFSQNPAIASVIFAEDFFRNDKRLSKMVYEIMQEYQLIIRRIIEAGQQNGDIRSDLKSEQLSIILTGSLRVVVTQWRLAEFTFDLINEGQKMWDTLEMMIKNK